MALRDSGAPAVWQTSDDVGKQIVEVRPVRSLYASQETDLHACGLRAGSCQSLQARLPVVAVAGTKRAGVTCADDTSMPMACHQLQHVSSGCFGVAGDRKSLQGKLTFVDLAGKENLSKTGNVGDHMQKSNRSLYYLEQCINVLRFNLTNSAGESRSVPYRSSKVAPTDILSLQSMMCMPSIPCKEGASTCRRGCQCKADGRWPTAS